MHEDIQEKLEAPFRLKARKGLGGKTFKYIPAEDVVDRMNKVFEGNWDTEVRSTEIIEDNILMCVRVHITDKEGNSYWHDGYASHQLARYSDGINKGKIIDVGNAYRSAMSKAIKTACTRWGVGLYLEENENPAVENPTIPTETLGSPVSMGNSPGAIPAVIPIASNTPPPVEYRDSAPVLDIPIVEDKKANASVVGPPLDVRITNKPSPVETMPFNNEENNVVKDIDESMEKLTPVQKVAIETVMSTKKIKFKDLAAQALKGTLPPTIDDVTYLDAVTMIQYGNHLEQNY